MPPRKARQRRASSQVARHPGTLFTRVRRQLRRLHDPGDTAAGTALAFLLLIGEAVLCVLIIRKVPCEFSGRCVQTTAWAHLNGVGWGGVALPAES